MSPNRGRFFFLILRLIPGFILTVVLISPVTVQALVGDTEGVFGMDGRLSTLAAVGSYSKLPSFFKNKELDYFIQASLRLMAGGRPLDRLNYEIHAVQGMDLTSADNNGLWLDAAAARYQALDGAWDQFAEGDARGRLTLDRLNVKLSFPWADLTLGRQAITFGKAYFWNPLDIFSPFEAQQFDRDYKTGVDAMRLDIPIKNFSGLNLIGVFGREITPPGYFLNRHKTWDSSWYGSALLLRLYTTVVEWDLAIQGGKVYGGYQIGGGAVGEIGPLEVRVEAAYFAAGGESTPLPFPLKGELLEDHWTAVFGLGRRFANSFTFEMEYLFNGAGDPDDLEASLVRLNHGSSLHLGRHLLGLMISYDIIPILNARMVWIYSCSDRSSFLQPMLSLSLSDEAELLFGAAVSLGRRPELDGLIPRLRSEFGIYPDFYFIELKYYF